MLAINERSGGGLAFAFLSFIMLFLLAITSTDWAVRKLGRRWFTLHSLIYLAYPLIILHAIKNGVDFSQADVFSISFSIVAAITIAFEAVRVYKDFSSKKPVPSASHTLGK
jgi:DMSO/TMAO reductase YedYZ heme-binding membrane subunit